MANPNIVNVTGIYANVASSTLTANTNTLLINNPASSGKVYKVNLITGANLSNSTAGNFTVRIYNQDDLGGTATQIIPTASIPFRSTLICFDKNSSFYLMEDMSVGVQSGAGEEISALASWEEISSS